MIGYDIVCANGVKLWGWYYDSYASVFEDGWWAYGMNRWKLSNRVRAERFYGMRSCFGGFASYNMQLLVKTKCKYEHFGWGYAKVKTFAKFVDLYKINTACEHLPINFCLRENGAKIAIASEATAYYGTFELHGV